MERDPPQGPAPVPALRGVVESERFGGALTELVENGLDLQKHLNRHRLRLRLLINGPVPQAILRVAEADNDDPVFSLGWLGRLKDPTIAPIGSDIGYMYSSE